MVKAHFEQGGEFHLKYTMQVTAEALAVESDNTEASASEGFVVSATARDA